jgi:hypothetical protein
MGSSTNFFVPHTRGPTKTIAVTATTGATALTTTASELYNYNVILSCVGSDPAFFELGASATTSATVAGSMAIMAGQTMVIEKGRATHIGAITSGTKTATLYVTVGMGDPSISGA